MNTSHPSIIRIDPPAQAPLVSFLVGNRALDEFAPDGSIRQNSLTLLAGPARSGRTTAALKMAIAAATDAKEFGLGPVIVASVGTCPPEGLLAEFAHMGCDPHLIDSHIRVTEVTTIAELVYAVARVAAESLKGATLADAPQRMPSMLIIDDAGLLNRSENPGDALATARASADALVLLAAGRLANAFRSVTGLDLALAIDVPVIEQRPMAVVATVRSFSKDPVSISNCAPSPWLYNSSLVFSVKDAGETLEVLKDRYGLHGAFQNK